LPASLQHGRAAPDSLTGSRDGINLFPEHVPGDI
jgi:hypothetical protein